MTEPEAGWCGQWNGTAIPLCTIGPAAVGQRQLGRYPLTGEERARGTRRHWEPILRTQLGPRPPQAQGPHLDNQGCSVGWGFLGNSELLSRRAQAGPAPTWQVACGLGPCPPPRSQSTAGCEPTWLGDTSPCLRGPWTISILLVTLSKVVQVAHISRLHAHETCKTLHVIVPGDKRSGVRAGVRGCSLGPRQAGRHSRGTAFPQQHP